MTHGTPSGGSPSAPRERNRNPRGDRGRRALTSLLGFTLVPTDQSAPVELELNGGWRRRLAAVGGI